MPEETPQVRNPTNPIQSNSRTNLKKILLVIGIVALLILALVSFLYLAAPKTTSTDTSKPQEKTATKSATSAAKTPPAAVAVDETASWKTYTNSAANFTIKYPSDWVYTDNATNNLCSEEQAFFAPIGSLLGKCASGFGGLIFVGTTQPPDTIENNVSQYNAADYTDFKKEDTTVGSKKAVRISGISQITSEIADTKGTKVIIYIVALSDRVLILSYNQNKDWADSSATFEKMVETLKFN